MVLLVFHVVDEHTAASFIDFETIMLLLGMMSIVAILRKSGFFSILSVKIAELTKGSPLKISGSFFHRHRGAVRLSG